ncbi:unnamed protein product [Linum trigynum]|uniref:Uncharacterized protein n=1 Tax=Linum trigynum TaxID=586398 RepID=A0AAV2EXA5_9ROSI
MPRNNLFLMLFHLPRNLPRNNMFLMLFLMPRNNLFLMVAEDVGAEWRCEIRAISVKCSTSIILKLLAEMKKKKNKYEYVVFENEVDVADFIGIRQLKMKKIKRSFIKEMLDKWVHECGTLVFKKRNNEIKPKVLTIEEEDLYKYTTFQGVELRWLIGIAPVMDSKSFSGD